MLTKPDCGWSDFQLEGTSIYGLSYLDDIAFDWVNQAINGLETLLPFCVKGFMEPNRFLCTVSYWNCHIVCEAEDRLPLTSNDVLNECSHTNMLEFCIYLHNDIQRYINDWISFPCGAIDDENDKKERLVLLDQKLKKLKQLILEREEYFDTKRCFL